MKVRLAILGASGRMGRSVEQAALEANMEIACRVSEGDSVDVLAGSGAQVVIDFSSPDATLAMARLAPSAGIAVVCGTTGLGADVEAALQEASRRVPVFVAANMSVGVQVLALVVEQAVRLLGASFDVEVVEAHHKRKVDAPSGTALRLVEAVRRGQSGEAQLVHGRQGRPGARAASEIGLHAVRGGDVIGDHTVHLLGDGERLELTHKASSRDLFARGAVRAAAWVVTQPPGRYAMSDLVRS